MLDSGEFSSLLDKGRTLQEEISTFIKAPTRSSSYQLKADIDALIGDIKQQLLNPSPTENNELSLVMINLGRIVKYLNDIKHALKTH
ncbi:MAG: hypothetical protein V4700_05620 [Pseudomonadota bacterium]